MNQKISIITPVFNGEKFIEDCLKNVIEQNCLDLEHIIIDGNSTDKTVEIVKKYAEKYSHIHWISERDQGQSDAMNKGIKMANGKILGILNADDYYEPNVLNRILAIFETLPEPTLLVGNCKVWGDEGKLKSINKPGHLKLKQLLLARQVHPINPAAYFYHRSLHEKIGLYKVEEHYGMDLDFILRAVKIAHVRYVDEEWGNWRRIEGTKTVSDANAGFLKNRREAILRSNWKLLPFPQRLEVMIRYPLSKEYRKLIKLIKNKKEG